LRPAPPDRRRQTYFGRPGPAAPRGLLHRHPRWRSRGDLPPPAAASPTGSRFCPPAGLRRPPG